MKKSYNFARSINKVRHQPRKKYHYHKPIVVPTESGKKLEDNKGPPLPPEPYDNLKKSRVLTSMYSRLG